MAASTAISAPLNAEPSVPDERSEQGLPPKSYATATKEPYEHQVQANGAASQQKDTTASGGGVNGVANDKVTFQKHSNGKGQVLTSIKPDAVYEQGVKHDRATAPRTSGRTSTRQDTPKSQLSSGRQAGAGWQRSAIRWAPLNVPLQRRLQTVAVLVHTLTPALCLSLFLLICAVPLVWPLLIPYLIYTLIYSEEGTDGRLSRRSERMRRSKWWSGFASYFPARLHRTVKLEPTRKYIFGYHPHGIISHGAWAAFSTEALGFADLFPGITNTVLTLDTNFRIPLYRDYILAMGLASVSKESIENILSRGGINGEGMGRAVTIVVGGARESLEAQPKSMRLVLNARKGFVKLAIRQGADLVPVLSFGENELYDQVDRHTHPWIHKWQMLVKRIMGFTIPLFHARGIFNYDVGLMPYRQEMNIVVGKPIKVRQQGLKDGHVDQEYLDRVHQEYVDELVGLWESYKDTFARDRTSELEIVE